MTILRCILYVFLFAECSTVYGKNIVFLTHIQGFTPPDSLSEEEYSDRLWYYYRYPLDLNYSTAEELRDLGILSTTQLDAFFEYIATYGKLMSIDEIGAIPTWDKETITKLLPFVRVVDRRERQKERGKRKSPFYQKVWGYVVPLARKNPFTQSSLDLYYSYQVGKYGAVGFQLNKKRGHAFESSYLGGYLMVKGVSYLNKAVLGRYTLRIGQGLVMGGWGRRPVGINVITTSNSSITPKQSGGEKQGLLGGSAIMNIGSSHWQLLVSCSRKSYVVHVYQDKTSGLSYFTTIPIAPPKRNQALLQSTLEGFALHYKGISKASLGMQYLAHQLTIPIQIKRGKAVSFADRHHYISFFGARQYRHHHLGGEVAYLWPKQWSCLVGGRFSVSKKWHIASRLHWCSDGYYSLSSGYNENKKAYGYRYLYVAGKWTSEKVSVLQAVDGYRKREQRSYCWQQGVGYISEVNYQPSAMHMRLVGKVEAQLQRTLASGTRPSSTVRKGAITLKSTDYWLPYVTGGSTVIKCQLKAYKGQVGLMYGMSQQLVYRTDYWYSRFGFLAFSASQGNAIYLTQPVLRFPYTKAYRGRGLGVTFCLRYYIGEEVYMEGSYQWTIAKMHSKKKGPYVAHQHTIHLGFRMILRSAMV